MKVCARLAALTIAAICFPAAASAQQAPGTVYAFGGLTWVHQDGPSGESPQTYVTAPGGGTVGWLAGAGVFVTRGISAEVELASSGTMVAREPSRYGITYNEERRDRFAAVVARIHLPRVGAVRIQPIAGLVLTMPGAWSQAERHRMWLPPEEALVKDPRQEHRLERKAGLTFGCDVQIGGGRMALVPTFRIADTGVSHGYYGGGSIRNPIGAIYPGGYPRWTVKSGVAFRISL
jgi:hypothetical protein